MAQMMIFRGTAESLVPVLGCKNPADANTILTWLHSIGAVRYEKTAQLSPDGQKGRKPKVWDAPSVMSVTIGFGPEDVSHPIATDGLVDLRPEPVPTGSGPAGVSLKSEMSELKSMVAALLAGRAVGIDPTAPENS